RPVGPRPARRGRTGRRARPLLDHGAAHPLMNPDGLSFRTPPARSVRAWVLAIARLLVGVIAGAVRVVTGPVALLYHVGGIIVSAVIAATLPFPFAFLARRLLASWSVIGNEEVFPLPSGAAVA